MPYKIIAKEDGEEILAYVSGSRLMGLGALRDATIIEADEAAREMAQLLTTDVGHLFDIEIVEISA